MLECAEEEELAEMPVELYMLDKLKARIQLAREIDGLEHKVKKENHEKKWLREAAEAMDIEIDSDMDLRCGANTIDHGFCLLISQLRDLKSARRWQ